MIVTILIPTTPERRERLQKTIASIQEHTTQPYRLMTYENNYEGYVAAIHVLLQGLDTLVWCLNDDVILKNDALKILTERFLSLYPAMNGLCQPADGIQVDNVATLPFCHSKVMEKLTFKGYHHNFADAEFTAVMRELKLFTYVPEALVEHEHWINKKAEKDMTYGYSANKFDQDQKLFDIRLANKFQPKNA